MSARFGHFSALQNDDALRKRERGQAMRDDDRRAAAGRDLQRFEERLLRCQVSVRSSAPC